MAPVVVRSLVLFAAVLTSDVATPPLFPLSPAAPDYDFVALAVTSHLQTHGFSIVIGESTRSVNIFVDTLALFLSEFERLRSNRCELPHKNHYIPDLYVQVGGACVCVCVTVCQ